MDSPKHIKCINEGKTGQYYRIAGKNSYKCTSCGHIANGIEFEPIEYTWKENPEKWRVWVDKRISEDAEKLIDKIIKDVKEPKRKLIG